MTTGSSGTRTIEYEGGTIRRSLTRVSPAPTIEQQLRFGRRTLGLSPEEPLLLNIFIDEGRNLF